MDKSKRNLAKVLGVVGAGSTVWKQPVVDSVVLPLHASTTGATFFSASAPRTRFGEDAGEPVGPMWMCVTAGAENTNVVFQGHANNSRNEVNIPANGSGNSFILGNSFDCETCRFDCTVTSLSDDSVEISCVSTDQNDCSPGFGWRATVPSGSCESPTNLDGDCNS